MTLFIYIFLCESSSQFKFDSPPRYIIFDCDPLQPRFYSVASSPLRGGDRGGHRALVDAVDAVDAAGSGAGRRAAAAETKVANALSPYAVSATADERGILTIVLSIVDYTVDVGDGLQVRVVENPVTPVITTVVISCESATHNLTCSLHIFKITLILKMQFDLLP